MRQSQAVLPHNFGGVPPAAVGHHWVPPTGMSSAPATMGVGGPLPQLSELMDPSHSGLLLLLWALVGHLSLLLVSVLLHCVLVAPSPSVYASHSPHTPGNTEESEYVSPFFLYLRTVDAPLGIARGHGHRRYMFILGTPQARITDMMH